MNQIEPVLPRRHKTDPGARLSPDTVINSVSAGKGFGGEPLVIYHPRFLRNRGILQANVQPPPRHVEIGRHERQPERIAIDDRGRLDRILHGLQPDPKPRKPAERPAVKAEIQNFLNPCRGYHRHIGIDHRPIGLVQHGRTFAGVIVAHCHQHTAMRRGAGHIGMAHHIARAVNPRPLAVPQRENPVVSALSTQFGLLGAPDRRGGQIFVQSGLKADVIRLQQLSGPGHLQIDPPQRRSAIARYIARRVQPGRPVARLLHQHQAHQGLCAIQQYRRFFEIELVRKADIVPRHAALPGDDRPSL